MLVLAAQNRIPFRTFLFSNVGDDSENPDTLTYHRETALPYAKAAGLELIEVWRTLRNGDRETIYQRINRADTKSVVIPIRGQNGKPMARDCTADFKVRVIGKWLKAHGATPENKATVAMGISVDEIHRANTLRAQDYEQLIYPLLDLRMRRTDCEQVIRDAGLPVPPKSACWFCPFHKPSYWSSVDEETFYRAAELENVINERQATSGREPLYITRFGRPLLEAPLERTQETLFDDDHCDNGWCMT